jgi:hypothetical protein
MTFKEKSRKNKIFKSAWLQMNQNILRKSNFRKSIEIFTKLK